VTVRLDATRHALCGDTAADARIAQDLARLGAGLEAELGDALRALILVGPYARGEGSVVSADGELQPAGHYPLLALHDGSLAHDSVHVQHTAQQWSALLEVAVHVRPFPLSALGAVPATLLWMDVSHGMFKLVAGLPGQLQALRMIQPNQIPASEITRLLSDAARELALARLEADPALERLVRALHHSVLALGDATLLGMGRYVHSLVERASVLESAGTDAWLTAAYRDAIRYTSRPDLWTPPGGETWYGEALEQLRQVHLAMEHRRVGAPRDLERLARWGGRLFEDGARGSGALPGPLRLLFARGLRTEERAYRCNLLLAYGASEPIRGAAARLLAGKGRPLARERLAAELSALANTAVREVRPQPIDLARYA
jgi:hypothetical protein